MFVLRPLYEAVSDLTYEPWRIPDAHSPWKWNKTTHDVVREKIAAIGPDDSKPCEKLNVLVIGPKAHGKSSFINAVASVSLNDRTTVCNAGGVKVDADNVTTVYRHINFLGEFQGFRLCDVRGLTKEQRASENFNEDLKKLIEGRIKPGYKFDTTKPIAEGDPYYNSEPTPKDMIHCVIILFDITEAYEVHSSHEADIKKIMEGLHETNVPVCVMLTKADILDPSVRRNIENIYHSKKVLRAVERAEVSLRVPQKNIHPVVNFEKEIRFEWKTSLPLLAALKPCATMARSHFYNDSRNQGDKDKKKRDKPDQ